MVSYIWMELSLFSQPWYRVSWLELSIPSQPRHHISRLESSRSYSWHQISWLELSIPFQPWHQISWMGVRDFPSPIGRISPRPLRAHTVNYLVQCLPHTLCSWYSTVQKATNLLAFPLSPLFLVLMEILYSKSVCFKLHIFPHYYYSSRVTSRMVFPCFV